MNEQANQILEQVKTNPDSFTSIVLCTVWDRSVVYGNCSPQEWDETLNGGDVDTIKVSFSEPGQWTGRSNSRHIEIVKDCCSGNWSIWQDSKGS